MNATRLGNEDAEISAARVAPVTNTYGVNEGGLRPPAEDQCLAEESAEKRRRIPAIVATPKTMSHGCQIGANVGQQDMHGSQANICG